MKPAIPTITTASSVAPLDRLMLWLALLQGSSFTLSVALNGNLPLPGSTAATLVTLLWAMMYGLSAVGLLMAFGLNWLSWLVRYRLLLTVLVAGTAFSAFWSIDARLSTERGLHLIGTTLVAFHIGLRLPLSVIIRDSARAFALLLALSVMAALFYPVLGLENYQGRLVWRGVMASKNTLGFWAAVSTLLFLTRVAMSPALGARVGWLLMTAIAMFCLVESVSATSALALVVATLVMCYLHAATSLKLGILPMVILGVLVSSLAAFAFLFIDTAELIGRSGDLTGRAQVWEETWRLIQARPLGGYGYGTIWFPTDASLWIQQSLTDLTWTVYHAHNGLLHIASEIGIPLTILTLLMIMQQLVESVWCQYYRPQPGILFVIGFSVALLVSNYSEARLLINRDLFWIFLVALPISMVQQIELVAGTVMPTPVPFPGQGRKQPAARRARRVRQQDLKRRLQAGLSQDANTSDQLEGVVVPRGSTQRPSDHRDGLPGDSQHPGQLPQLPPRPQ